MEGVDKAMQDRVVIVHVVMTKHDEQDTDPFGDVYILDSFLHRVNYKAKSLPKVLNLRKAFYLRCQRHLIGRGVELAVVEFGV